MSVHYSPGAHPVAVTPHGLAVLAADTSPALAARIHALLAEGRGLGGVLEALTGAYGTSLSAVPPFAVAFAERGAVRLAVRGPFALEVTAADSERISGEGVTTWTERVVAEVSRVELAGGADAAPPEFPVSDGVVLAGRLVWVPVEQGAPASAERTAAVPVAPAVSAPVAPEPVAEPATEAVAEPVAEPDPAPEPEPAPKPEPEPDHAGAEASDPTPTPTPTPARGAAASDARPRVAVVPAPAAIPAAATPQPAGPGLIDSAAVLSVADTLLPAESTLIPAHERESEREQAAEPADPIDATVARPSPASPASVVLGDHDGATVSLADARALRTGDSAPPPLAPPRPPAPGRIRVSTGQVMLLDRTVVIGRRPRSTRVSGTDLPHLVAVDSPQQDISRSHVELRVEGDSIVATDLHTTNGTTLLRHGVDPVRLHPGEGTVVVPGDVIDLGDGITVAIEELS
jgi:hypothetical protein